MFSSTSVPPQLTGDHAHVYEWVANNTMHGGDPDGYIRNTLMFHPDETRPLSDVDMQQYAWNHMRPVPSIVDQFHQQYPGANLDNLLSGANQVANTMLEAAPAPSTSTTGPPPEIELRLVSPTVVTPSSSISSYGTMSLPGPPQVGAGKMMMKGGKGYIKPKPKVGGPFVLVSVNPSPGLLRYPNYKEELCPSDHQFVAPESVWNRLQACQHVVFPPESNPWPGINRIQSVPEGGKPVTFCFRMKPETTDPRIIEKFVRSLPGDTPCPPSWVVHTITQNEMARTSGGKVPKMAKRMMRRAKVAGGYSMSRPDGDDDYNASRRAAARMGFEDERPSSFRDDDIDMPRQMRSDKEPQAADELADLFKQLRSSETSKARGSMGQYDDPDTRRILSSRRY